MKSQNSERIHAVDALRAVAIIAVVMIHTTTRTLETSHYDLVNFPFTILLNQLARFAVPLFFLISGFVLELNYKNHTNFWAYLKKRFNRIFIPYVFWSIFYYFVIYKNHGANFWSDLATGSASYQLYFIPSLLIFYLTFPLLHKVYKFLSNKWIFVVLGIIQIWFLYDDYFTHGITLAYPISVALFNYFVFIVGMVASHNKEVILKIVEKYKYVFFGVTILLAGYVFLEGRDLYLKNYNYLSFYSQWRPSVLFYTLAIFSIAFFFFTKIKHGKRVINILSRLSFFVFFVHVAVLETLWSLFGHYLYNLLTVNFFGKIIFAPIWFLGVLTTSTLVAYIVRKVPNISKLTG